MVQRLWKTTSTHPVSATQKTGTGIHALSGHLSSCSSLSPPSPQTRAGGLCWEKEGGGAAMVQSQVLLEARPVCSPFFSMAPTSRHSRGGAISGGANCSDSSGSTKPGRRGQRRRVSEEARKGRTRPGSPRGCTTFAKTSPATLGAQSKRKVPTRQLTRGRKMEALELKTDLFFKNTQQMRKQLMGLEVD